MSLIKKITPHVGKLQLLVACMQRIKYRMDNDQDYQDLVEDLLLEIEGMDYQNTMELADLLKVWYNLNLDGFSID